MRSLLIHNDLWNYVNGMEAKPDATIAENAEAARKWAEKDQKALATILLGVSSTEICHAKNANHAKEPWDNLNQVYAPRGISTKVSLMKRLLSLKMQPEEGMQQHLSNFFDLSDKLTELGMNTLPDEVRSIILLNDLPDEYEMFTVAIENRDELPKVEILKTKLIEEELRIKGKQKEESSHAANVAKPHSKHLLKPLSSNDESRKGPNNKIKCHYCHKKGHKISNCFLKANHEKQRLPKTKNESMSVVMLNVDVLRPTQLKSTWIIDSGTSSHMCNVKELFCDIETNLNKKEVILPNKQKLEVLGKGIIRIQM